MLTVAFLTNYYNHHQKYLADEMYRILGDGNYYLIETTDIPEFRKKLGYKKCTAPYLLRYGEESKEDIEHIIAVFDVVIYTSGPWFPMKPIMQRYKEGKLTFCYSERRYKSISRYLKYPIHCCLSRYVNKGYLLCASAFAARDYRLSGISAEKCLRWGYFPEVKLYDDIDSIIDSKYSNTNVVNKISILWVGRLIEWKHPEAVVFVAERLKAEGYDFEISIVGGGDLEQQIRDSVEKKGLGENVHLLGSMTPEEVREHMVKADIFLFTSDRNEGWGVVLNESMNSACAVVASDAIGAVPYLISNGGNGLVYRSGDNEDLYQGVKRLIEDPGQRKRIQVAAYRTITDIWSPRNAAQRFMKFAEGILQGTPVVYGEGPCSKAPLI